MAFPKFNSEEEEKAHLEMMKKIVIEDIIKPSEIPCLEPSTFTLLMGGVFIFCLIYTVHMHCELKKVRRKLNRYIICTSLTIAWHIYIYSNIVLTYFDYFEDIRPIDFEDEVFCCLYFLIGIAAQKWFFNHANNEIKKRLYEHYERGLLISDFIKAKDECRLLYVSKAGHSHLFKEDDFEIQIIE